MSSDRSFLPTARVARLTAALLALCLVLAACGGGDGAQGSDSDTDDGAESSDADAAEGEDGDADAAAAEESDELGVAVASYDLAVGEGERLMAGLFSQAQELLVYGEVTFQLGYLGEEQGGEADLREPQAAEFLPVPGMEPPGSGDQPTLTGRADADGSGVYAAEVTFDQPGYWGLRVMAETEDGREMEGNTVFSVFEDKGAPEVGEEAPRSENWTMDDLEAGDVEPTAVDSRASDGEVPDPEMHQSTVAETIEEGRPAVVALSTPVFCVSRFCGPLMEEMAELEEQYGDRAEFIHIEVWEDYESSVLNEAAEPWIETNDGDREPWVYVVDGEGTITARWDNVVDRDEFVETLEALPTA